MTLSTHKTLKRAALSFFMIATLLVSVLLVGTFAYANSDPYVFDETTGTLTFNTDEAVDSWAGTEIDNTSIKELIFGENVTLIPGGKFRNVPDVESITFLGDITVKSGAFYNIVALESVTFNGDAILEAGSFTSCPSITEISFTGKSEINGGVFSGTSSIESITFGDSVILNSGGLFSGLSNLKSVTFPVGSVIPQGVFNSTGLERVVFEGDIEVSASFSASASLKYVEFKGTSKLSNGAFSNAPIETLIFGGKTELGAGGLAAASLKVTSLTFPAGSTFASGSIYNLPNLTELTFLGDVDLASGGVFSTTPALKKVTFHGTSNINNGAFTNVPVIEEVNFGDAAYISSGAFSYNSSLKALVFPAGSTFGPGVFYNLSALESITFEGDFDLSGSSGSFYILPALKTVTFGGAVKSSYDALFCANYEYDGVNPPVITKNDDLSLVFLAETPDIHAEFFGDLSSDIEIIIPCNADFDAYVTTFETDGYNALVDNLTVAEHVWNNGEITTPATCSATGVKTYTCTLDPEHTYTEDVAIDANAHSFGEWKAEVAATTEKEGTKAHKTCALCQQNFDENGKEITDLTIAKLTPTVDTPESENNDEEKSSKNKATFIVIGATSGTLSLATVAGVLIKKKKIKFLSKFSK